MGLLIANDNLLTALGITNKEQFDLTFADFSEFETFVEKCGYEYDFDEDGNLILITPKSKEINTGINGVKPVKNYFKITALEPGTINMTKSDKELYWSTDGKSWTLSPVSESIISIETTTGTNLYLRGSNTKYDYYSNGSYGAFKTSTCNYNVSGNIMSLFYDEDFEDKVSFPENNTFILRGLLGNDDHLINAKDLLLPATTLTNYCYDYMFYCCTSLVAAPELPATTLAEGCYRYMFHYCPKLVLAPELPATTLAGGCYLDMFSGCTLTTAPELPATTLAASCYSNMFKQCTSLTTAPELPATTLVLSCYSGMFLLCTNLNYIKAMFTTTPGIVYTKGWVSSVSPTGTFVKNSTATWNNTGGDGVPSGWTVETADS